MSDNLIMLDFAPNDPRSVAAMFRGTGDGREQSWLTFEAVQPAISQEEIMEKFSLEVRYGRIKNKSKRQLTSAKKWQLALIGLAIIIF